MHSRGQTTTFQTRLEISEYAEARVARHLHRDGSRVLSLDSTEVATTITQTRAHRLNLPDGTPCHWPGEYLSKRIEGSDLAVAPASPWLGTAHPFSGSQDGCLLAR